MSLLCVLVFLPAHEPIYFMECAPSQNVLLPLLMVYFVTRMYCYYYYYSLFLRIHFSAIHHNCPRPYFCNAAQIAQVSYPI